MKRAFTISAATYKFAAHLASSASPESLAGNHMAMSAPPDDLRHWKISRQEWSLAHAAAAESRKTGRDVEDFLKAAGDLLNSMAISRINASGDNVFEMFGDVGGATPR